MITNDKIKSSIEIGEILVARGKKKVSMCHGCFDLIHPGHIRYFDFSKRNADILVVSVTTDKHVNKGELRPYIPQNLRMEQLAALQVVDYVCLSEFETADHVLEDIKPDYYIKGIEYENSTGRARERLEIEKSIVEKYGGQIVYANDPVVMSSTKILSDKAHEIEKEKIRFLLKNNNVSFDFITSIIEEFKNERILVVGETIIDRYHYCKYAGCSSKDPIITLNHDHTDEFLGGAYVVAKHFQKFCGNVTLLTCANEKDFPQEIFTKVINISKTITKDRYLSLNGQKLLKVDYLDNKEISIEAKNKLIQYFEKIIKTVDIVVFSDFGHGFLTQSIIDELLKKIPEKVFVVADVQDRMHDYFQINSVKKYKGISLITPNEKEARISFGDSTSGITSLARKILEETNNRYIILKMGKNGLMAMKRQQKREDYQIYQNYISLNTFESNPIDTVGCGDSVLCAGTLALSVTNNIFVATILANAAGGIMSTKRGNELYSKEEFIEYVKNIGLWG
jgi:rfaE bifunctional protein kinase chain/domain/rfaE bifunctional protein nucleotidyltransferase chain/domain